MTALALPAPARARPHPSAVRKGKTPPSRHGKPAPVTAAGRLAAGKPIAAAGKPIAAAGKPIAASAAQARSSDDVPAPAETDPDRDRIVRLQEALREIVHGPTLGRTRVGVRVMEARTGRLFFGRRGGVLMDPASNQKVLATTAAIMRLGADWRFRTELSGPAPDANGVIAGDVYLRGGGDPTVRSVDLERMAAGLARRGVTRIDGAVVADPRSIGNDEPPPSEPLAEAGAAPPLAPAPPGGKSQVATQVVTDIRGVDSVVPGPASPRAALMVNRGLMLIRVRPGPQAGAPAEITTNPADESFDVRNTARTVPGGRTRVGVRVWMAGGRIQIDISGRIAVGHLGLAFRRKVPHQALYAAVLLRASLVQAGITVRDRARWGPTPPRLAATREAPALLERHESEPLGILLRRINKDSDNDQAERVLETAGAEVYGGAPSPDKGVQLLREVIGELGLSPNSYVPRNGSGLGHSNRITADAMAKLLRELYLDPRVGPEILQSLSVGGVDGTTRNRFKGALAARRVRAKTGTLNGKSCLSGLVGDGPDVIVFSILVEGLRPRMLTPVRSAQVGAVNAIMRYVREGSGERIEAPAGGEPPAGGIDYETGGEENVDVEGTPTEPGDAGKAGEDPVDTFLKKERERADPK
jgi:D-alanyl-D-alanine carboxypeptidase/D-alanyl-D-alanine-endopeptidase (penicillin-binding protein 4)